MPRRGAWWLLGALILAPAAQAQGSCYGGVASGRLEGGVQLPSDGPNFSAYSALGRTLGRTYVHANVRDIVVEAYAALAVSHADKVFVYGETGLSEGGRMRPHRTHRNGTSVDFMVPVLDAKGRSLPLPTSALNKFGYAIEFDRDGRFEGYRIDFDALAAHLAALRAAARRRQFDLRLVIFDDAYLPRLLAADAAAGLADLPYMKGKPWVRHDEHYHVDFAVPCKPL